LEQAERLPSRGALRGVTGGMRLGADRVRVCPHKFAVAPLRLRSDDRGAHGRALGGYQCCGGVRLVEGCAKTAGARASAYDCRRRRGGRHDVTCRGSGIRTARGGGRGSTLYAASSARDTAPRRRDVVETGRRGNDQRRALDLDRARRPPDSASLRLTRPPQAPLPGIQRPLFSRHGLRGVRRPSLVGLVDDSHVPLAFALVPAAFLGKLFGTALLGRLSEKTFRNAAPGVTLLTCTLGVGSTVWTIL
jgi:hypothetical protein